ncbi:MAG: DUF927 domain-containing protein [Anaerolineaceae bacterium]|nr:DUF927 domain-containing protein [Anaerolineaceae bacterium]
MTANNQPIQHTFLDALYGPAPEGLYLELRCIHPETGEVRTLWAQIGNERQRNSTLKQAGKLNNEGYGVYYAPCLRQTKQGKAEAAALMPALWVDIDCDDDPVRRESGLAALHGFVLPPSAILNNGGGWHAYWLLDMPFALQSDDDRQRIARVLHGLFSALDGDPGYVKSVASVMRLPGSTNTKPGRNNAPVEIVEWDPEHRYPLSAFDWLDVTPPKPERIGKLEVITLNGNGHHSLPPRTEAYLTSGAPLEQRNTELFAAACQLRDAGYSQRDAENELIARYLADGNGSENPAGREKEARATISSVFSRPQREPLAAPKELAREQVARLVGNYAPDQRQEHPTAAQIAEVVQACAHLNAIEWAEERGRLKAICGDGLRLVDLDRLYRQARRDLDRERLPNEDRYLVLDGSIVFEKITERGINRQRVADWSAQVLERSSRLDDDGQVEHLVRLELRQGERTQLLTVPSELFGDANALQRHIARQAGERFTARTGMNKHLPTALLSLSGEYPTRTTYRFLGWTQIDGHWTYVTPGLAVSAAGIVEQPPEVELETRLRDYGLTVSDWSESLAAFTALTATLPPAIAPALLAYAFLPLAQRFFPAAAPKPALHLQGTTGTGKSEIAALLCSFYGNFTRDLPPGQWGDTVNTVETLGYSLADALYWVDDYKTIYADERTFTRFLQSYSRGMGRGRLTREAKLRQERPCRGHILSTGETTLEGEASILARMIVLKVTPWSERDPDGQALIRADRLREYLSGFTVAFAAWIAQQVEEHGLGAKLAQGFADSTRGYQDRLASQGMPPASVGRLVQNWAVLVTTYRLLDAFLRERDADEALPIWCDTLLEGTQAMRAERAGLLFLDGLQQLLASGELMLATDLRQPEEARPGTTIVGYHDGQHALILPDVAYRAVARIHPLQFNAAAIGAQLQEDGWLIPGTNSLTVQRRVRGIPTRFWQLKAGFIQM